MTLRQEILNCLPEYIYAEQTTNNILKLFENLIDEKIQYIGSDGIGETATGSINYWRRKTLQELKEELKK